MSGSVPMDVDTTVVETTKHSSTASPQLTNTTPLHAPNVEEMTVQEEKEHHCRKGEEEYIKSLQSKIDVLITKLQRAQEYKNFCSI